MENMNDEEKQAIEGLKGSQKWIRQQIRLGNLPNYNQGHYADIQIVLNLIEKQSKEIEEYKKQLDLDYVDKHFVPIERYNQLEKEIEELKEDNKHQWEERCKLTFELENSTSNDKIKAKIDELDKQEEDLQNSISNISWELMDIQIRREVLQSLLEKE